MHKAIEEAARAVWMARKPGLLEAELDDSPGGRACRRMRAGATPEIAAEIRTALGVLYATAPPEARPWLDELLGDG